jgi:hypothetical protein
MNEQAS